MITAQHIISDIRTIVTSAGNSDDFKASDEQILFWINEVRSMLIAQAIAKRDTISDSWIQYINCFPMEMRDISDCCDVPTGCYGLRSVNPLPGTIETDANNMIIGIYTIDDQQISEINRIRARYQKYNKYTGTKPGWFIKDNYLYIVGNEALAMVNVAGIWEDPSDLANYTSCAGVACWSTGSEYPVSLKMASTITDIVVKTKYGVMMGFPMDQSNNASAATPQQNQQNKTE